MTFWPASLKMSTITSLRKSASDDSVPAPAPKSQTLCAQASNSRSWVTPRSSVTASYLVRPGDLRPVLGSPPSRCSTTSVERLSAPILLMPATYRPSHLTRNLKFLYGSKRVGFTVNSAMPLSPPRAPASGPAACVLGLNLAGDLLDLDDHELGGLERREADDDVDDAEIAVVLGRGLGVAPHEVRVLGRGPLEGALAEQVVHEGADVEPDLRPERLVRRPRHAPPAPAVQRLLEVQGQAADGDVLPLRRQHVGAVERACPPTEVAVDVERAQAVHAERVERAVLGVGERVLQLLHVGERGLGASRRLPHASPGIGARIDPRDRAAGGQAPEAVAV